MAVLMSEARNAASESVPRFGGLVVVVVMKSILPAGFLPWSARCLAAWCVLVAEAGAMTAFLSGNSVTDEVKYAPLSALAAARGRTLTIARHSIPGSSIKFRWQNPNSGFTTQPYGAYPGAAVNHDWDALVLQPFDSLLPDDTTYGGLHTTALDGRAANTDTPVYIYARYPKKRTLSYTEQWNVPYTPGDFTTVDGKDYFERLRAVWAENHPTHPVRIIPVGHVFHELDVRMRAGLIPGYDSIYDLYTWSVNPSDNVHVEDTGSYVVACTFFAVLLGETPEGLPHADYAGVTPAFAAAVQDAVWDVVTSTPHTGVAGVVGPVEIATLLLPPGLTGQAYDLRLQAVKGTPPYVWSLGGGTLPPGLTLSADGAISGTPTEAGTTMLDLKVEAGGTAQASLALVIEADSAPVITTDEAPSARMGELTLWSLTASGGNGTLTWALGSGALPPGLELRADGTVIGTPRRAGFFPFGARVTDGDASGAESATREYVLRVGLPAVDTLWVEQVTGAIVVDGVANEADWKLDQPIARVAHGAGAGPSSFGALWDGAALHLAIRTADTAPLNDSADAWDDDAFEVFIDARHDREDVYNADDRRILVRADGSLGGVGDLSGITRAVATADGVRTLELRIRWSNLGLAPTSGLTIGLDVAINDDDDGGARDGRLFWRGDGTADTVPKFGAAILRPGDALGHREAGGLLVIEAEAYATATAGGTTSWTLTTSPAGYVGTGAMITPDAGFSTATFASGAKLVYPINITTAGDYTVWLRRIGPDGDSNSVYLGLDGAQVGDATFDNGAFASAWGWFKGTAKVTLGAGTHTLELRHREDGYGVDRMVLALDAAYAPSAVNGGAGPTESEYRAVVEAGYAGWAAQFFWEEPQSAVAADPDADGVPNFWEYALGGDPVLAGAGDAAGGGRVKVETRPDGRVALAYRRARAELSYQVERSPDLAAWSTVGVTQASSAVGEQARAVTDEPLGDGADGARVFLRLRVAAE
jgi:hypothetical protein